MGTQVKKVGFVARGLTKGGVTRYILNVLRELEQVPDVEVWLFTDRDDFVERFPRFKVVHMPKSFLLWWDWVTLLRQLRRFELDVIFYPKNIIPITHACLKAKKINIIHDLGYFDKQLKTYEFFDTLYMKMFLGLSCRLAHRVVAISEATKKEIVEILKVDPAHVSVVLEAVEDEFTRLEADETWQHLVGEYGLKQPYLYYCGNLTSRKNILRVLQAFDQIKGDIPHDFYISTGDMADYPEIDRFIAENLMGRVKILPFLTGKPLVMMYSMAALYVYPGLYEGFGLPILEAQACGCPLLTSNVRSCPEVAGEGAHIVDPYSVEAIREGILHILGDEAYRQELVRRGYENTKRFHWSKTAKELLRLAG